MTRWILPTLYVLVTAELALFALVPRDWRWPMTAVTVVTAVGLVIVQARHQPASRSNRNTQEATTLLRVVTELRTTGTALLAEFEKVIAMSPEKYRQDRKRVIDWTKTSYDRLAQLDEVEAERFGRPDEAESGIDRNAHVTTGNIAPGPLITHLRVRLKRLDAIRDSV